jgi:hypothetical protein
MKSVEFHNLYLTPSGPACLWVPKHLWETSDQKLPETERFYNLIIGRGLFYAKKLKRPNFGGQIGPWGGLKSKSCIR